MGVETIFSTDETVVPTPTLLFPPARGREGPGVVFDNLEVSPIGY